MSDSRSDLRRQGGRRRAETPRQAHKREKAERRLHEPDLPGHESRHTPDHNGLGGPPTAVPNGPSAVPNGRPYAAPPVADPTAEIPVVGTRAAGPPAVRPHQPRGRRATSAPAAEARTPKRPGRLRKVLAILGAALWLAGLAGAALGFAEREGWLGVPDVFARLGAVTATWVAVVVLIRRCGGRPVLTGLFAAGLLGLAVVFPENWALAGAAVVTATTYGLLGALLTRPASGLKALRELLVAAFVGLLGAVVVSGYDVSLRSLRFRVLVMALVLIAGFALAWRIGHGARSLGRRGVFLILSGALLLAVSIAYSRAITEWGSPEVVQSMRDARSMLSDNFGAVPRPIEALVGFPALVWGVAIRARRRQGWWMCAFGALGATGVATAFVQKGAEPLPTLLGTGYNLVIGAVLGLLLMAVDRLLTGGGRRARAAAVADAERPEPARFEPLL